MNVLAVSIEIHPSAYLVLGSIAAFGLSVWHLCQHQRHVERYAKAGPIKFEEYLKRRGRLVIGQDTIRTYWRPHFVMDAFFAIFCATGIGGLLSEGEPVVSSLGVLISLLAIGAIRLSRLDVVINRSPSEVRVSSREVSWVFWRSRRMVYGSSLTFDTKMVPGENSKCVLTACNERGETVQLLPIRAAIVWDPAMSKETLDPLAVLLTNWCTETAGDRAE